MSENPEKAKPFLINVEEVPWEPYARGRFGSEDRDLTQHVQARKLDVTLTRLAPGQVSGPYHFHHAEEELFYVMEGTGRLRYGGEERRVRPGDVIGCPTGPAGAHQFENDGDSPLVYLAISTVEPWEICEYPDSDKVLARAVGPDGTRAYRALFPRSAKVDYWHGETLAEAGDARTDTDGA
jgi:uncharacterized cupin superfamily protein